MLCVPWVGLPLVLVIMIPVAISRDIMAAAHRWGLTYFFFGVALGVYLVRNHCGDDNSVPRPESLYTPHTHSYLFWFVRSGVGSNTIEMAQSLCRSTATILNTIGDACYFIARLADSFARWT